LLAVEGLSKCAAEEMRLKAGIAVASGMIDAHAAYVGTIGCRSSGSPDTLIATRLVIIAGTSTCHLINSGKRVLVPGVWGPQAGSTLDGYYTLEGGQSATGTVLEYLVKNHAAYEEAKGLAEAAGQSIFDFLNKRIEKMAKERGLERPNYLVSHLHVLPDFHGNRSPRPSSLPAGTIIGLSLSQDLDSVALIYYAGLHSLVYGTLEIIQKLALHGVEVKEVVLSGGMARNKTFAKLHAEILRVPVILPTEAEHGSVRGAAIVGSLAAGRKNAVFELGGTGEIVEVENDEKLEKWHSAKFDVVLELVRVSEKARSDMIRVSE
jgi:FGGY-family pentulose kinase